MHPRLSSVAIGCVLPFAGSPALSQCTTWLTPPPTPGGVVTSLASWDPDGPGPAPPVLAAGLLTTTGVVTWNGQAWSPLPGFASGVAALLVHDGDLIAGSFERVARWTGSSWADLGAPGSVGGVLSLGHEPGGALVAGISPSGPALQFDGATWNLMNNYSGTFGYAMLTYAGSLIACGSGFFGPAARWDGQNWFPLGTPPSTFLISAAVYQGDLVAGANGVYRWNGTDWQTLGLTTPTDTSVGALLADGPSLYAGGTFSGLGGVTASRIARFDGTSWQAIGAGVAGSSVRVYAMVRHNGELPIAGRFTSAGGVTATNVARLGCATCYPNCDGSAGVPLLNVNDFICFQSRFAAQDLYADCDHTGLLNVNDFVCFQGAFAAGCQ